MMIQTPTDLAEFVSSATSYLKLSLNVKIFVKMLKILALTANLSHIPRVQKLGLRPTALAFLYPRPGQKLAQAKGWARLGPAFFGLAWPGFWPQAGAGTSLHSNRNVRFLPALLHQIQHHSILGKSRMSCIVTSMDTSILPYVVHSKKRRPGTIRKH